MRLNLFFVFALAMISFGETLPVARFAAPPVIDGDLSDDAWKNVQPSVPFHGLGAGDRANAKVRMGQDGQWLYLAFECESPAPEKMKILATERDGGVMGDESVEIFLAPKGPKMTYFHLGINPNNVREDRLCSAADNVIDRDWNPAWRSAVKRSEKGWGVEIAFPIAEIARHGDLRAVGLNLARNQTTANGGRANGCLAPVKASYKEVETFPTITNLASEKTPFLPAIVSTKIGALNFDKNAYAYDITLVVQNQSPATGGEAFLAAKERSGKNIREVSQKVFLAPGETKTAVLRAPTAPVFDRSLEVALKCGDAREVLQATRVDTTALVPLTAWARRSYYTTEPEAEIVCRVGLPKTVTMGRSLIVRANGEVLAETPLPGPDVVCRVPLKTLPADKTTPLSVAFDGPLSALAVPVALVKLSPNPGKEVKIDHLTRKLLITDKPFYLICASSPNGSDAFFKKTAATGFDAAFQWRYGKKSKAIAAVFAEAEKAGLPLLEDLVGYAHDDFRERYTASCGVKDKQAREAFCRETFFKNLPDILAAVKILKNQNALLAYNTFKPCHNLGLTLQAETLRKDLRAIDPYRPTFILFDHLLNDNADSLALADIAAMDPFWDAGVGTPMAIVLNVARKGALLAAKRHKPFWLCPFADFYGGVQDKRFAWSAEEADRFMFLTAISGADGIILDFTSSFSRQVGKEAFEKSLNDAAKKFQTLTPYLIGETLGEKSFATNGRIACRLFRGPDGAAAALAMNLTDAPVKADVLFEGFDVQSANDIFSGNDVTVKANAIALALPAKGTAAVKLSVSGPLDKAGAKIQ